MPFPVADFLFFVLHTLWEVRIKMRAVSCWRVFVYKEDKQKAAQVFSGWSSAITKCLLSLPNTMCVANLLLVSANFGRHLDHSTPHR